jgi:hypothetical protein
MNEIGEEDKIVVGEEELDSIPLDHYYRIFSYQQSIQLQAILKLTKNKWDFFKHYWSTRWILINMSIVFWGGN